MTRTAPSHHRTHVRTVAIVLAVLLAVVGGAWVAARVVASNTPPPLDIEDSVAVATLDPTQPFEPEGTWTSTAGSEAGYRIGENLGGRQAEVIGRTSAVTGTVTVGDGRLTGTEIVVDVSAIATDDSARDAYFRRAMDTSTYPEASFRLTEAATLPDLTSGEQARLTVTGELTLHGTVQPVTAEIRAQRTVDGIEVAGAIPVVLEDFGLFAPDLTFVSVDEAGTIEFRILLTR